MVSEDRVKAFAMNREYSDIRRCALAFGDRSERIYYLGFVDGRTYGQKGVLPMPGNVTGPFMCGRTPPDYKYCPTCVFAEGKSLLSTCMMYPGTSIKPKVVDEGGPCKWYLKME